MTFDAPTEGIFQKLFSDGEQNGTTEIELDKLLLFLADIYDTNPVVAPLNVGEVEIKKEKHDLLLGADLIASHTRNTALLLSQILAKDLLQGKSVFDNKFYEGLAVRLADDRKKTLEDITENTVQEKRKRIIALRETSYYDIKASVDSSLPEVPNPNSAPLDFATYLCDILKKDKDFCDEIVDLMLFARVGIFIPTGRLSKNGVDITLNGSTKLEISRPVDGMFGLAYAEIIPAPERLVLDRIQIQVGGELVIKQVEGSQLLISSNRGLLTFAQLKELVKSSKDKNSHKSELIKAIDDRIFSDLHIEVPKGVEVRVSSSGGEIIFVDSCGVVLGHIGAIGISGNCEVEIESCQGDVLVVGTNPENTKLTIINSGGDVLRASDANIEVTGSKFGKLHFTACEGYATNTEGSITRLRSDRFQITE